MDPTLPPLAAASAVPSVLLLLFVGHLLGDFGLQTRWMVEGKGEGRTGVLAAHAGVVTSVHLVVLLPHMGWAVILASASIGVAHGAIDGLKTAWIRRGPASRSADRSADRSVDRNVDQGADASDDRSTGASAGGGADGRPRGGSAATLGLFLLDQAAHGVVILVAFWAARELAGAFPVHLSGEWLRGWQTVGVVLAALAFNCNGGGAIVSGVLATLSPELEAAEEAGSGLKGSGRLIGILERTITLVLIVLGQWAAIVLLLAAKSIARFEELKDRRFAEYYLVGTLTSILVAIVTGLVLVAFLYGAAPSGPGG